MKRILATALLATLLAAPHAQAADRRLELALQDVINSPEARDAGIDGSVRFFFAGQNHPALSSRMGDGVSNRKTNGVGKSDETACRWAALSALLAFQNSAKAQGANAVVDMVSYYKKNTFSSPTHYECHAGSVVVGVTLKGTYARID